MSRGRFPAKPMILRRRDGGAPDGNAFAIEVAHSAHTRTLRNARLLLHAKSPNCHWCGRATIAISNDAGVLPDDAATVDHLVSRHHRGPGQPVDIVLSCLACNRQRNERELREMTPQEKLARCGDGRGK